MADYFPDLEGEVTLPLQHTRLHQHSGNVYVRPVHEPDSGDDAEPAKLSKEPKSQIKKQKKPKLNYGVSKPSLVQKFDYAAIVSMTKPTSVRLPEKYPAVLTSPSDINFPAGLFSEPELQALGIPPVLPESRSEFLVLRETMMRKFPKDRQLLDTIARQPYEPVPRYFEDYFPLPYEYVAPPPVTVRRRSASMVTRVEKETLGKDARRNRTAEFKEIARQHWMKHKVEVEDRHILRQWYITLLTSEVVTGNNVASRSAFRDILRFGLKWNVDLQRIKNLVFKPVQQISFGSIPIELGDLEQEEAHQRYNDVRMAPVSTKSSTNDKDNKAEQKSMKEIREAIARRVYKPQLTDVAYKDIKPVQVEDTTVRLLGLIDPNLTSKLSFLFKFCYIDATQEGQPLERSYMHLTVNNNRIDRAVERKEGWTKQNAYVPTHRIQDVTGIEYLPLLRRLFPHLLPSAEDQKRKDKAVSDGKTKKEPDYFDRLHAARQFDARYFLVTLYHNDQPWTSNILTSRNMPIAHGALKAVVRSSCDNGSVTPIHVLVRSTNLPKQLLNLYRQFQRLSTYNPWCEFFVDSRQQQLSMKGLKPYGEMGNFVVGRSFSFETWKELQRTIWICDFKSQSWQNDTDTPYQADALFIPVPGRFSQIHALHLSFFVVLTLQYERNRPRMVEGDQVVLYVGQGHLALPIGWKGRVTQTSAALGMGTVTLSIDRPSAKCEWLDKQPLSSFTMSELRGITPQEFQVSAQNATKNPVTVYRVTHPKELERHLKACREFDMSDKEASKNPKKLELLDMWKTFLTCKDHESLPTEGMWWDIAEEDHNAMTEIASDRLRDHQLPHWQHFIGNYGAVARHAAILGPSGSGKSHMGRLLASAYMYNVNVNPVTYRHTYRARARYLKQVVDESESEDGDNEDDKEPGVTDNPTWDNSDAAWGNDAVTENVTTEGFDDFPGETTALELQAGYEAITIETSYIGKDNKEVVEKAYQERGRILQLAQGNATVEEMHAKGMVLYEDIRNQRDSGPGLYIRMYPRSIEKATATAVIDPLFEYGPEEPLYRVTDEDIAGDLMSSLEEQYRALKQGSKYRHVRDARFITDKYSLARYTFELAGVEDDPTKSMEENRSAEIWNAFNRNEVLLQQIKEELEPLHTAASMLLDQNGIYSKDIKSKANEAAKRGQYWLLHYAHVVTTTISVALDANVYLLRRPHFILIEEATKASEAHLDGLFSHYYNAKFFQVGDNKQPGPQSFCPASINNFQAQEELSLLARLEKTGYYIPVLTHTSRFGNQEMLDICRIVNKMPALQMAEGAAQPEKEALARKLNQELYHIPSCAIMLSIRASPRKDATDSTFCTQTAVVAMHDIIRRLEHFPGEKIALVTFYRGQMNLYTHMFAWAIKEAKKKGMFQVAHGLQQVLRWTVNTAQGRENDHIILDTCCVVNVFTYDEARTIVAATRSTTSFVLIGDGMKMTMSDQFSHSHPFKQIVRELANNENPELGRIYDMSPDQFARIKTDFREVFEALGIAGYAGC